MFETPPRIRPLSSFIGVSVLPSSEVQAKGTKVAGGVVCVDHVRGRDGDKELVAGPQLEKSSLVDGMEGVLSIWGPALCSHPLQELCTSKGN